MRKDSKSKKIIFFMMLILWSSWVFPVAATCAQPAAAPVAVTAKKTPIAQVVWIKGSVTAVAPDNTSRVLKRRDAIFEKDTLISDPSSTGEIVFSDGGLLAIREDSELRISEYKFNKAAPAGDKQVVDVVKGGFRTITGAISKVSPDSYQVKTPVATIGVRGTDYSLVFKKKCDKNTAGNEKCGLLLKINNGIIEVSSDGGSLTLNAGSGNAFAMVGADGIPISMADDPYGIFANDLTLDPATFGFGGPGGSGGGSGSGSFCIQ